MTKQMKKKIKQKKDYKKAFEILIEYFDDIPDDDKQMVDKKLKKCNL